MRLDGERGASPNREPTADTDDLNDNTRRSEYLGLTGLPHTETRAFATWTAKRFLGPDGSDVMG
jgi:hypothetical protein